MKTLILICGASGQGKSTLAKAIQFYFCGGEGSDVSCSIHEADKYMMENGQYVFNPKKLGYAHNSCREAVEKDMLIETNIIIQSNTNIKKKDRNPYHLLAIKYGYKVKEIFITGDNFGNVHGVPAEKVAEMEKSLQF